MEPSSWKPFIGARNILVLNILDEKKCFQSEKQACHRISDPVFLKPVTKQGNNAHTIWTAPASAEVPALSQLDMSMPLTQSPESRQRIEAAIKRAEEVQAGYATRSSAASLRKLVR